MGVAPVLLAASAIFAAGVFALVYRRDAAAMLAGVPLMAGGAGLAMAGASRFASSIQDPVAGQEFAVVLALAALGTVAVGLGLAQREGPR